VRQVAEALGISKSECGRIRLRLIEDGALDVSEADEVGERTASLTYSATS
jgi:DNA-binding Lrp family transcriptional regulator